MSEKSQFYRDAIARGIKVTHGDMVYLCDEVEQLEAKLADVKVWCPDCKGHGKWRYNLHGFDREHECQTCHSKGYTTEAK